MELCLFAFDRWFSFRNRLSSRLEVDAGVALHDDAEDAECRMTLSVADDEMTKTS